ncbi:translation initiation factor eIF-2B subunit delta isoform X2 [Arachis ipaensis]|uniref:translation initiation factor eIF-2B subunit delta isoform X2 n=1 Tax=Arachis ipaensis TaxID=130454 RepID=UPI0007AF4F5F|nr:translation initiation factor eIF-2B subunit delta isoform X2 [Arachis ipaensis]XP_025681745.1 translation initiation factor eIF-2B subunit delta isoform X2 [Arachis hypogaea]
MDPKFRRVGFEPDPNQSQYPLTVPPPRLLSERTAAVPVPEIGFRRQFPGDRIPIGSYNPSLALLGTSPSAASTPTSEYRDGDGEFSEDSSGWFLRSESSFAVTEFDLPAKPLENSSENCLTGSVNSKNVAGSRAGAIAGTTERMEGTAKEERNDVPSISKPVKANTTKAERRALQEAQRAAKATSKVVLYPADGRAEPGKGVKQSSGKKDGPPVTSSTAADKKSGGRSWEKERKKDVPPPRMQFDDKSRVEKAKRRALVNQTEAVNRVELFRHLPQYEYGSQLPKLESKLFQIDSVHPSVFKVGLRYLAGGTSGDNARCIEMLRAFQEAIRDYSTPPEKALVRDLTAKIGSYVSFFTECRPLSISMGNAIRFVKSRIAKLPLSHSESEAKATLYSDIDRFINEKIILAAKVIVGHAATKVRDGDVLLIYGSSSVVEMILLYAHELGKQFRVVVVDSRPKLQSQALIRRLLAKGVDCTYTLINGVSYVMHEVTRVFLGASAVLSNGTVYSRIGTACVAMVAHAFHVPVLVCCEAYKFHERVQLDSICSNELGDPNAVATVPGRMNVNYLDNWTSEDNLQILNLMFDVTPSDYISAIVTDHGMVPPTSVPVIVREYGREHLI